VTEEQADQLLFTYGTLRRPEVQLDTFGRLLDGHRDILEGHTIDYADLDDARETGTGEVSVHPILRATGNSADKVVGVVSAMTESELHAADDFECTLYRRVAVTLASGVGAWVYVR